MKLACADFAWPLLPHADVLRLIRMLEIDALDLGVFAARSHIRPEIVRQDIALWAGVLRERIAQAGLELADVFVQNALDFATLAPNHPDAAQRDASLALFLDMLELARLLERTPGLTLTLDYTHFTYVGIPDAEIEPLVPYARHVQGRGARKGRLQTRFQDNAIDYGRLLRRLQETGYAGYFAIEYVWTAWQRTSARRSCCATSSGRRWPGRRTRHQRRALRLSRSPRKRHGAPVVDLGNLG